MPLFNTNKYKFTRDGKGIKIKSEILTGTDKDNFNLIIDPRASTGAGKVDGTVALADERIGERFIIFDNNLLKKLKFDVSKNINMTDFAGKTADDASAVAKLNDLLVNKLNNVSSNAQEKLLANKLIEIINTL